ncbi:MAG: DM13 domain-containing protein [Nitrosopumilus sp.]|nr:DM13 domain-containing protein [Nitrosopumilus sp.]MDH3487251.1 DM13 domain-containing protein [Nitrosopumilus sp.]
MILKSIINPQLSKLVKKGVWIAIMTGVVIAIGGGLSSPLFYETSIDESLPGKLNEIEKGLTFEKFVSMEDSKRQNVVDIMPSEVQDMIMQKAATMSKEISEDITSDDEIQVLQSGEFEGLVGHDAKGVAKILKISDSMYLRFENFQVTNGPDLRVYLTNNGDVKTGIHLDKLKGSKGNQNYLLDGTNWQKYDTVVIYCKPFGVHFGQAKLVDTDVNTMEDNQNLFFTLQGDNHVGMLDNTRLDAGPMMTYVDSNDSGSLILATSSGSDTLYVFDSSQEQVTINVGKAPKGVKIHPDESMAFVANEGSGTISVVDLKSWKVTKEIEVGKVPHNIRFDSIGTIAYVTLQGEDKIAIIDVDNLEMTDSIPVEKFPHNLDLSPDGSYLYVANIGTNDVAVIDLEKKEIIKRIKVSAGHHGIDVTNDGQRIYVSGIGSDKVNVIDAESLELIKQIDVGNGPHGIRANADGSKVYVGITGTDEIVIIDAETLEIEERTKVGKVPFWLAIPQNP